MATAAMPTRENSGNPAFNSDAARALYRESATRTMTIGGTAAKTFLLLLFVFAGGAWGWAAATEPVGVDLGSGYANTTVTIPGGFWLASFGALFVGIFLAFNPQRAPLLSIIYAVLEGFCLGAISAMFDAQTEGIVAAAILSTAGVFLAALFMYATRLVRPTRKMAFAVIAGLAGLSLMYLFVWVLAIFDWGFLYSEEFRTVGIVVTVLAVVLAAFSLTLDFGFIENATEAGAPKVLEWYSAYSLTVTLIWLYVTILRLLALLARNR
jgi:uncharacterized YccA/Bax inhibitor family protein